MAGTRGNGTRALMPHDSAPLWVWHAWLVHGADPDGAGGVDCPDGCDEHGTDYQRLELLRKAGA